MHGYAYDYVCMCVCADPEGWVISNRDSSDPAEVLADRKKVGL